MLKTNFLDQLKQFLSDFLLKNYTLVFDEFVIDKNQDIANGPFYSNLAMTLAAKLKKPPLDLANEIKQKLDEKPNELFHQVLVTKPGYLNFYPSFDYSNKLINENIKSKVNFGQYAKKELKYNLEFVSANPTGYLHIAHARNGAIGQALANIWRKFGIEVEEEYYINDAGNQINLLAHSVYFRYLELFEKTNCSLPEAFYAGDDIKACALALKEKYNEELLNKKVINNLLKDQMCLETIKQFAVAFFLEQIKKDLARLQVNIDVFTSEKDILAADKMFDYVVNHLSNYSFKEDGALFLRTSLRGDDKDRVLIKSDGAYTYFLSDIIYHYDKWSRKRETKVDELYVIWGADHKSYVDRIKIALEFFDIKKLNVIIMQMVHLNKNSQAFKLSKRSGNTFSINDLIDAIGYEKSRWFLTAQNTNAQIEIDLDKLIQDDLKNEFFYVNYTYARINSILEKVDLKEKLKDKFVNSDLLIHPKEQIFITELIYYPYLIKTIASSCEVNKLHTYIYNLARTFNKYYDEIKLLDESVKQELKEARLVLLVCLKNIFLSSLGLLDIVPKEKV